VKCLLGAQLLGKLLALYSNYRLGWEGLPGTNTLVHFEHSCITGVKRFITFGLGCKNPKLFQFEENGKSSWLLHNKWPCPAYILQGKNKSWRMCQLWRRILHLSLGGINHFQKCASIKLWPGFEFETRNPIHKTFSSLQLTSGPNELECLYLVSLNNLFLCLRVRLDPIRAEHLRSVTLLGRLLELLANIILGFKGQLGTNALAFWPIGILRRKKVLLQHCSRHVVTNFLSVIG